jgi:two-component system, OmpR family, sensor kinase
MQQVEARGDRRRHQLVDEVPRSPSAATHEHETDEQRAAEFVHELKQPLSTIAIAIRTLAERADVPPDPAVLQVIDRQVAVGLQRLDQLLLLLRGDLGDLPVRPAPLDLRRVAEQVASDHRITVPDREVAVAVADDVAVVADPELLEHVLGNLLSNALRHAPAGTTVAVEATVADGEVTIEVVDQGPGVDLAVADHLFEPFQSSSGGTGLGLTIVRRFVEANGGRVWLRPRGEDRGTVVAFTLPVASHD